MHTGIDIAAPKNARVAAAGSGVVVFSGPRGTLGHTVMVRHGGSSYTVYGHLARRAVMKGHRVRRGDTLGYVGSSGVSAGPHLHFEVRKGGRSLDPMRFLR
jgi:murein DD-endopeptidase MepM/ murein hydrolase activator NlpD